MERRLCSECGCLTDSDHDYCWPGKCVACSNKGLDKDARIAALDAQLREREDECERRIVAKNLEYGEILRRAESAEAALAAAREENERLRKAYEDEREGAHYMAGVVLEQKRELAALRSRADDAGRVEWVAQMMFKMMRLKLPKMYQFEDEPEWWMGNARLLLAAADGKGRVRS